MRERAEAARILGDVDRERAGIAARQLTSAARDDLKGRRARLEELQRSMTDIAPAAVAGEGLISAAVVTSRRLNELRSFDHGPLWSPASHAKLIR